MGFLFSKMLWTSEPEDYDVADTRTGLTPRQVNIIRGTWELVKKDVKGNGIDLFLMLFDRHPEYQKMFRAFADVPRDQLPKNGRLLGHATSVMYAITSLVDNLEDFGCLNELLVKIAVSHVPRKVTGKHFRNLSVVILTLLNEKLGPKLMDEAGNEAWRKTLEAVNSIIIAELDKGQSQ